MNYGSGIHIISILVLLIGLAALWMILRRCSVKVQRRAVLLIMLLNTVQHFLKIFIYPHYAGMGFSHIVTAYNMCAFLIIISPAVYLWGNRLFQNLICVIGTIAGIGVIAIPVWFIGMDAKALGWEYARFYICHSMLFFSSALPLLLKHHCPSYKEFWQVGLGFLIALCAVLVNNVILVSAGFYGGADSHNMYAALLSRNSCMMMGPPDRWPWIREIASVFTPSVLMGNNPAGNDVPILWYAIPVYLGISIISLLIFSVADYRNLKEDLKRFRKSK